MRFDHFMVSCVLLPSREPCSIGVNSEASFDELPPGRQLETQVVLHKPAGEFALTREAKLWLWLMGIATLVWLVALGMAVGAMDSETIGSYSYKRPTSPGARRTAIARSFTPRPRSGTLHVRTGSDRVTTVGAVASDAGS